MSLPLHKSEPASATDARISFQIAIARSTRAVGVSPFVLRNKSPREPIPAPFILLWYPQRLIRRFTYSIEMPGKLRFSAVLDRPSIIPKE